MKIRI